MESIKLPIEIVPNTVPPKFRWKQVVNTPIGKQVVDHEGQLPVEVERAVERLISVARGYAMECAALQGTVSKLEERVVELQERRGDVSLAPSKTKRG